MEKDKYLERKVDTERMRQWGKHTQKGYKNTERKGDKDRKKDSGTQKQKNGSVCVFNWVWQRHQDILRERERMASNLSN